MMESFLDCRSHMIVCKSYNLCALFFVRIQCIFLEIVSVLLMRELVEAHNTAVQVTRHEEPEHSQTVHTIELSPRETGGSYNAWQKYKKGTLE